MSPGLYTESALVERPALELLAELGWTVVDAYGETLGPAGTLGRDSIHDVILTHRLRDALRTLNLTVPDDVREEALAALVKDRSAMDPVRANRDVYQLLRDGYRAEWRDDRGEPVFATVRYLDFNDSTKNDWLAASQVWVAGELHRRRADTILFVNGIPLVLAEFKEISRPVKAAYDENLCDYRDTVPQLFTPNCFVILSNGSQAKVGATYAPWDFFGNWKVIDADGTRGVVELETAIRGTCAHDRLLDMVENFVAYIERPRGLVKSVARNHQVLGVNRAVEAVHNREALGGKLGVFWHTQGSGKSFEMVFYAARIMRDARMANPTLVFITDRTDLDDQLFEEVFAPAAILPERPQQASSRAELRQLLRRVSALS